MCIQRCWTVLAVFVLILTGCQSAMPISEEPVVLDMPESIVYEISSYGGVYRLEIYGDGETALTFLENEEEPVVENLSQEQIVELNALYGSIEDFTSPGEILSDTTMTVDGEIVELCMEWTTQVELEQYIRLLMSYFHNSEYDWLVRQYDGVERWNDRMLPSAYKDMELWMDDSDWAMVSDLIPKENLDEIELLDGNVYQYFAAYGMDYVREDGDCYYACYRSDDEVLTVWFDRNGTKLKTERRILG